MDAAEQLRRLCTLRMRKEYLRQGQAWISSPQNGLAGGGSGGGGGGPPPPVLLAQPIFDNFTGASANLTGRVTTTGAATWAALPGTSGNSAPAKTDGAGHATGAQGSGTNANFVALTIPNAPAEVWTTTRHYTGQASVSVSRMAHHITDRGTGNFDQLFLTWTASGNSGAMKLLYSINGTGQAAGTALVTWANIDYEKGDIIQTRYYQSGGHLLADLVQNGQVVGLAVDTNASAITQTFAFGFLGNFGQSVANAASMLDEIELGDPTAHGMLTAFAPARVVQLQSNGDVILSFAGDYTMQAPAGLTYSLIDGSGNPVSGQTAQAVASLATAAATPASTGVGHVPAGGGSFTGKSARIPAANVPAILQYGLTRSDIVGGGTVTSYSPQFKAGQVVLTTGQSLMQRLATQATGGPAQPADSWMYDASTGAGSNYFVTSEDLARVNRVPANSIMALLATTLRTYMANVPIGLIRSGVGGTNASQRVPGGGSNAFESGVNGIKRAGGDFGWLWDFPGQFDYDNGPLQAAFTANLLTIYRAFANVVGHDLKVMLLPVGAFWNNNGSADVGAEAMRRLAWKMTQDYASPSAGSPTIFLGPYTFDDEHVDTFHPTSYTEEGRRMSLEGARYMSGNIAASRLGPIFDPTTPPTADLVGKTVTATFLLGQFTGMAMANVGANGEYRGGIRFWQDAAHIFNNEYLPFNVNISAPAGGKVQVTWSFSTLPTKPFLTGPAGVNPMNPGSWSGGVWTAPPSTVATNWSTQMVMLGGTIVSEPNVPCQPYYVGASGPDGIQSV